MKSQKISTARTSQVAILITAAVLMLLISGIQQYYARKQIRNNLERTAEMELIIKAIDVRHSVEDVSLALRNRSWEFEKFLPYPDSLFAVTRRIVEQNPNFAGCCIAMVPKYVPRAYFGRLVPHYADGNPKGPWCHSSVPDGPSNHGRRLLDSHDQPAAQHLRRPADPLYHGRWRENGWRL